MTPEQYKLEYNTQWAKKESGAAPLGLPDGQLRQQLQRRQDEKKHKNESINPTVDLQKYRGNSPKQGSYATSFHLNQSLEQSTAPQKVQGKFAKLRIGNIALGWNFAIACAGNRLAQVKRRRYSVGKSATTKTTPKHTKKDARKRK